MPEEKGLGMPVRLILAVMVVVITVLILSTLFGNYKSNFLAFGRENANLGSFLPVMAYRFTR